MKITRDTGRAPGEERQVYRRGAQPAAPETPAENAEGPPPPQRPPAEAAAGPGRGGHPRPAAPQSLRRGPGQSVHGRPPAAGAAGGRGPKPPVRRRRFPIGLVIVLVMLALVAYGGWQLLKTLYQEVDGAGENGEIQTITIEQGSSVADIAAQLESSGIVQHGWLFRYYTQYSGRAEGLQYGDFELYPAWATTISSPPCPSRRSAADHPRHHPGRHHRPWLLAQLFVDQGLVDSVETFLDCANGTDGSDFSQYEFWNQIPDNPDRLFKCEGYLFPGDL